MTRVTGILKLSVIVSQLICTAGLAAPAVAPPAAEEPHSPASVHHALMRPHHLAGARRASSRHRARKMVAVAAPASATEDPEREALPPLPNGTLSPQEQQVRKIAVQFGDRDFLMVDKPGGRVVLFEDGEPVYVGSALTGQSTADSLPPGALSEKFAELVAVKDKVTPAGRFTITPGFDPHYGPLFDINEIQGKDWGIAIHQVYLGDSVGKPCRQAAVAKQRRQTHHLWLH